MAVRGTTPDYTLTLAGYDMTGQRPYVTIRQGSTQLTLTGDRLAVTVDESGSAIAFSLTQQETLRFKVGAADVQVKTIDAGGSAQRDSVSCCVPHLRGRRCDAADFR